MMKNTIYILTIFAILLLSSCSNESNTLSNNKTPELLDRPIELAGVEWDKVQTIYQDSKLKIAENPNANDANLKLAEVFMHEARVTGEHGHYYPAALKVLDQVLSDKELEKDLKFNALLYKGSVMLSQHEFEEARSLSLQAMKLNTYNAQLYGTLVDALVELGDYEAAVQMADKMVSIRPDLRSYARISYLREIHGDLDGAIEAMTIAAESGLPGQEQTAWAELTLGELYEKNNEPLKAAYVYEQILKERANYPFAIAALGKLKLEEKKYEESEALLTKAANIIPEVGYYCDLARIYKETDQETKFDETIVEIEAMLQDDVDSGHNMNMEYASIYLDLVEDVEKAEMYVNKEYQIRPKNIDVNKLMAKVLMAKNETAKAKPHLDYIMSINDKSAEIIDMQSQLSMKI